MKLRRWLLSLSDGAFDVSENLLKKARFYEKSAENSAFSGDISINILMANWYKGMAQSWLDLGTKLSRVDDWLSKRI